MYTLASNQKEPVCGTTKFKNSLTDIIGIVPTDRFDKDIEKIARFLYGKENYLSSIYFKRDNGDYSAPKEGIKGILTKYVVDDMVMSESENRLIYILNKVSDGIFAAYERNYMTKYMTILKGGNVLRAHFIEFVNRYLRESAPIIFDKYSQYFAKSDLDFGIENIHEHENYGDTVEDYDHNFATTDQLLPLCWYIMSIARMIILSNFGGIYDFCKLNMFSFESELKKLLDQIKNKQAEFGAPLSDVEYIGIGFNNNVYLEGYDYQDILRSVEEGDGIYKFTDVIQDRMPNYVPEIFKKIGSYKSDLLVVPSIDKTRDVLANGSLDEYFVHNVKHVDFNIFYDNLFPQPFNLVKKKTLPTETSTLYVSVNKFVSKGTQDFRLARLMIAFTVIYRHDGKFGAFSVPSELYDLSLGIKLKDTLKKKVPANLYYNRYHYSFEEISDNILIYSPLTCIADIADILFTQNKFPWTDKKYKKRLIRLIVMTRYGDMLYGGNPFSTEKIYNDYILPLRVKVDGIEDDEERAEALKNLIELIETFSEVKDDFDSYFKKSNSKINQRVNIYPVDPKDIKIKS